MVVEFDTGACWKSEAVNYGSPIKSEVALRLRDPLTNRGDQRPAAKAQTGNPKRCDNDRGPFQARQPPGAIAAADAIFRRSRSPP